MKNKILREYIINAVVSGIYIIAGLWCTITSANRQAYINGRISELESNAETMNQLPYLMEKFLNFIMDIINQFLLYIFGILPLSAGIIAVILASVAFCIMKDKPQKTTGYHIAMVFSYSILGVVTALYLLTVLVPLIVTFVI
ncbi:MAG: hypothetical protein NC340_08000 [Ruminococcus flavefaciens]|nr:hypothetical protein [Ruminococcus flavefaciens]MCM1229920.1 hypothetical protein [Ruminococcus flavefaciens]